MVSWRCGDRVLRNRVRGTPPSRKKKGRRGFAFAKRLGCDDAAGRLVCRDEKSPPVAEEGPAHTPTHRACATHATGTAPAMERATGVPRCDERRGLSFFRSKKEEPRHKFSYVTSLTHYSFFLFVSLPVLALFLSVIVMPVMAVMCVCRTARCRARRGPGVSTPGGPLSPGASAASLRRSPRISFFPKIPSFFPTLGFTPGPPPRVRSAPPPGPPRWRTLPSLPDSGLRGIAGATSFSAAPARTRRGAPACSAPTCSSAGTACRRRCTTSASTRALCATAASLCLGRESGIHSGYRQPRFLWCLEQHVRHGSRVSRQAKTGRIHRTAAFPGGPKGASKKVARGTSGLASRWPKTMSRNVPAAPQWSHGPPGFWYAGLQCGSLGS